MEDPNHLDD
jgi:hypothetical protein